MSDLTVIILTHNESLHIERCIKSLQAFAKEIFIIDSYSTDNTIEIAGNLGARIYQNPWVNHANQFQWALDNCPVNTAWIMRMDADEYALPELAGEINTKLDNLQENISGIILKRRVFFMGKWIRFGGYYPVKLLRIWRKDKGRIESRWMDEHIYTTGGESIEFSNDIVDYNLNNLSWWIQKHNNYATREAIDLLNIKYDLYKEEVIKANLNNNQLTRIRWFKAHIYCNLPLFLRPFLYFIYRYFFQLGFLDGKTGLVCHFLQGFWYRFLVDAKILQILKHSKSTGQSVKESISTLYNFKL